MTSKGGKNPLGDADVCPEQLSLEEQQCTQHTVRQEVTDHTQTYPSLSVTTAQ